MAIELATESQVCNDSNESAWGVLIHKTYLTNLIVTAYRIGDSVIAQGSCLGYKACYKANGGTFGMFTGIDCNMLC